MLTRIVFGLVLTVVFVGVAPATLAATAPVGATAGNFSVDQNGGATYTIPITAPPGTAGMAPHIALTYTKSVDNPITGIGFSISGLSVITRCGGTIALDGVKGGVNYDANDRFCLDGQRLIAISSTVCGTNGSEYRTEHENFSRVCAYRDPSFTGGGPQYFRVTQKDGSTSEYGVTPDSRIEAAPKNGVTQTTVRLWALNKVQDTSGNYYTVSYSEDNVNGEYHPTRIDYTGNAGASLAPYNSICFVYDNDSVALPACGAAPLTTRTDITARYEAGSVIKTMRRLSHIQSYADTALVRSYRLIYNNNGAPSGATGASRLTSLQECGSDGVCSPATTLQWSSNRDNPTFLPSLPTYIGSGGSPSDRWFTMADVNGDGKTDVVKYEPASGYVGVWLSNGDGSFTAGAATAGAAGTSPTYIGSGGSPSDRWFELDDVNGDGRSDVVKYEPASGYVGVWLSNGDGSFTAGPSTYIGDGGGPWDRWFMTADATGDGKTDVVKYEPASGYVGTWKTSGPVVEDMLASVTNGLSAVTTITYKPLTDNTVYTKESGSAYPYQDVQNATYVVSRLTQSDGLGGQHATSYHYSGAKVHLTGPGWLGFHIRQTTDELSGIVTTDNLNQTYDGTEGTPNYTEVRVGSTNGPLVSRQDHFWSAVDLGGGRRLARLDGTLSQSYELNNTNPITCTQVNNTYDSFGNITQGVASTDITCGFTNAFVKTTTSTYTNDTTRWILGQLTQLQATSHAPGQTDKTRTSSFVHDPATGLITTETIEPGNTTLALTTSYTYDGFGNRTSATVSGPGITARGSSITYDTRGRFALSTTNALGLSTGAVTYDPKWGAVLTQTDPNGISLSSGYDGFGRKILETRPDGTTASITYAACDAICPSLASYTVTTQSSGSAPAIAYFDILGRAIRSQTIGLTGATVYKDTQYDNQGRVAQSSLPYFSGDIIRWNVPTYDALGRVTVLTEPDGGVTTTIYNGLTTTVQQSGPNITTRSRTSVKDAVGHLISVVDSLYPTQPTTYQYDAANNLTKVTDPAGNQTTMVYDQRGNKTQMSDPDMGIWNYSYNTIGQLTSQTDAKGQTQTVTYDLLGRFKTRTTLEGTSTWTYDTATKGIGKLAGVSGPNGYQESYTYDSLSRSSTGIFTIDAASYTTTTIYNSLGQVDATTYPSTGFAIKRIYNTNGYLTEIRNNQSNALYWQANQADALGHITSETLGNGLTTTTTYDAASGTLSSLLTSGSAGTAQNESFTFDVLGNLLSRSDNLQGITETFNYDILNRLTSVTGSAPKTFQYDVIGNITSKSDVGTYTYNSSGAGSIRPHAVNATSGTLNNTYAYDANGSLTSGGGRTLTWTSFNKPAQISQGTTTSTLTYDANFNRIKKVTPSSTTIYVGSHYQRVTTGTLVEHKHYIGAGRATVVYTQRSTGTNDTRYLLTDHLGSVDTITDENGAVLQRLSNDAHGKRRNSNWTDATGAITSITPIGFTGHEMDDEAGLINMRAREYDPVLGRFMSADTAIDGISGQGLNRYTYVRNNPLSYTDPTGHKSERRKLMERFMKHGFDPGTAYLEAYVLKPRQDAFLMDHPKWQPVVKVVVDAVICYYTVGLGCAAGSAKFNYEFDRHMCMQSGGEAGGCRNQAERSAAVTFVSSMASSFSQSLGTVDMNTGAINWSAAATEVAVNGIAGGIVSELNGGSFEDGFRKAAFMSALNIAGQSMRGSQTALSKSSNGQGKSAGFLGDLFKLGGCREGNSGACLGGMQNGEGYLFAWVELDENGYSFVSWGVGRYTSGGILDRVIETFSGPHDWLNGLWDAYTEYGNGTNSMIGGDFTSFVNIGLAMPFAAANGISYYMGPNAMSIATGNFR